MSQGSSNHSPDLGKTAASSSRPNKVPRPGLPECIVGLAVLFVVGFVGDSQLSRLGLDPVVYGLVFTALSGIAGITGFAAAVLLRIRSLRPFALAHGINIVFPAAVVAGLATGEIYRRSGSVWTAVVVHVVFNLPTIPVMIAAGMG